MVRAVFSTHGALFGPQENSLVGLNDLLISFEGGNATLFAATRGDGWLTAYDVGNAAGQTQIEAQWRIAPNLLQLETTDLVLHETGGQLSLYMAGLKSGNLIGVQVELSGSGSPFRGTATASASGRDLGEFTEMELFAGSNQGIAALRSGGLVNVSFGANNRITISDINEGNAMRNAHASDLITTSHNGESYAFVSYGGEDTIGVFHQENGTMRHLGDVDVEDGFWADRPGAMAVTEAADGTLYVVSAASGSDSLSVLEVSSNGRNLTPVDHLIDSLDTRFSNASHVTSVTVNGQNFILAAGNDQGVSLLTVLPGGRLQHLAAMAASADTPLRGITSLEAMAVPNGIRFWIATEAAPFLSEFSISLPNLGQSRMGNTSGGTLNGTSRDDMLSGGAGNDQINGGNGNDIILDGAGEDRLTGGNGADTFILIEDGEDDTIADFNVAMDRIDLSDFNQLGAIGTLSIHSRSWGAEIRIDGEVLEVRSANGARLSAADFSPYNLIQGNRVETDPDLYPVGDVDPDPKETGSPAGAPPTAPAWQAAPNVTLVWRNGDFRGTSNAERIEGTEQADRLFGNDGNDTIVANSGADSINGEIGDDLIYGGQSNDLLLGSLGADMLSGENGNDTLSGGANNDTLNGGNGNDALLGGEDKDHIDGQANNDSIWAGEGADRVFGGEGDDWLSSDGSSGFSIDGMWGQGGNDTLFGSQNSDLLNGGSGNDTLDGRAGFDLLFGEEGNDIIFGNDGSDRLFGGAGHDRLFGGNGDDSIFGQEGDDTIWGGSGDDQFLAGSGDDVLDGGADNDTLDGGLGQDTLYGAEGNDQLEGGQGGDEFVFADNHGNDLISDFDVQSVDEVLNFEQISDLNNFDAVYAASGQVGADLLIRTGSDSTVYLIGVNRSELSQDDFAF